LRNSGPRTSDLGARVGTALAVLALCAACGKKGPPLAPLSMAPEAPQAFTARRLADAVYLQFHVPAKSAAGPGPYSIDHLNVYAVTIAAGSPLPANRFMLQNDNVVGRIEVRPPVDPDETPEEPATSDTRPHPGDAVTFVEALTPAQLVPASMPAGTAPAAGTPAAAATPPAALPAVPAVPAAPPAGAPAAAAGVGVLTRVYLVQGIAKNGNKGSPSARVAVPLLTAPGPARPGAATYDATSVTISWNPPLTSSDEAPGVSYNVYPAAPTPGAVTGAAPAAPAPLNDTPLTVTTFAHPGAEAGKEQCYVVRSVATVEAATIESAPSEPICVTPKDTFPPNAPKGLAAVSGAGAINLIWDANTDADLGGYLVLRGEAPGDTLQPLTPQPIRETRYRDTTVTPGVRYVYAIVAVDRSTPPNRSGPSNRVEETAR
jgi:hypothetical protein